MKERSIEAPVDLLLQLRKLLPRAPMNYGEARVVAQMQALRLRRLLNIDAMRLPLEWIEDIPNVKVEMVPAVEMEAITKSPSASGATDIRKDGTYKIYINENSSPTHCRFTLCHETFHLITGPFENEIFADFGHGDADLHHRRKESLADHFAANLLMPSALVKKAWGYGIQGVTELAEFFGVSEDAMLIRLKTVGLIRSGVTKQMFYRRPHLAIVGLQ